MSVIGKSDNEKTGENSKENKEYKYVCMYQYYLVFRLFCSLETYYFFHNDQVSNKQKTQNKKRNEK